MANKKSVPFIHSEKQNFSGIENKDTASLAGVKISKNTDIDLGASIYVTVAIKGQERVIAGVGDSVGVTIGDKYFDGEAAKRLNKDIVAAMSRYEKDKIFDPNEANEIRLIVKYGVKKVTKEETGKVL